MRSVEQLPPEDLPRLDRREAAFSPDFEHVFEASGPADGYRGPRSKGGDTFSNGGPHYQHTGSRSRQRPENDMQALMEAPPFTEPEVSKAENLPLKDALADAIDSLDERTRWVFEATHYQGMSVRDLGEMMSLSKTQVHRILQSATTQLRQVLGEKYGISE